ncbi:Hypothetical protein A7982_04256 [Minicystis rosea]|nr:Hypothetical protein A7982_04256 [Minicystis rosea]
MLVAVVLRRRAHQRQHGIPLQEPVALRGRHPPSELFVP